MSLPPCNLLLDSLPEALRQRLLPLMEPVELSLRAPIFDLDTQPRYVHFMLSGIASVITTMEGGDAVEIGIVGHEGFPEKIHLLGPQSGETTCFMQIPGSALRMDFKQFRSLFQNEPELQDAVHRYIQHDSLVLAQLSACNRLHEVEARLARWLLMVLDRVGGSELRLTQEFLGEMLGARRSSVNLAAGSLQRSGVISYTRGRICVISREALEDTACECYTIIGKLYRNLYS